MFAIVLVLTKNIITWLGAEMWVPQNCPVLNAFTSSSSSSSLTSPLLSPSLYTHSPQPHLPALDPPFKLAWEPLSGPLIWLNATLTLLHLDCHAIARPYPALSRIHLSAGVLNCLVLSHCRGSTARSLCDYVQNTHKTSQTRGTNAIKGPDGRLPPRPRLNPQPQGGGAGR